MKNGNKKSEIYVNLPKYFFPQGKKAILKSHERARLEIPKWNTIFKSSIPATSKYTGN